MEATLQRHADEFKIVFEPGHAIFDLSQENAAVFAALEQQEMRLKDTFATIRTLIPLPVSAKPSTTGPFYRLPSHNRSFCYSLAQSDSFFDGGALVFKGTEPLLADFPALVSWMLQAPLRKSRRVMADHFPLAEGKIPGVLTLKEAKREAQIALEVQRRHLHYYGVLARTPTPLAIYQLPQVQVAQIRSVLGRKLSKPAFDRIEAPLEQGVAIYIYHYPAPPIRTNYWGGASSAQLSDHIKRHFNPEAAISGWSKLLVRLLYLGFLPYTVRNEGLGACMDFGNATLDGGFCDPDSIVPMEESPDDEFFRESVIQSLEILETTVRLMLGFSDTPDLYPSIESFACRRYVQHLVLEAITSEKVPELRLDERFAKLIAPRSIADLNSCVTRKTRALSYSQFGK